MQNQINNKLETETAHAAEDGRRQQRDCLVQQCKCNLPLPAFSSFTLPMAFLVSLPIVGPFHKADKANLGSMAK
jgi:hypothetical protein